MRLYIFFFMFLSFMSCSKDGTSEPAIDNPVAFELVSPANGETCLDGVDQSDDQASVAFIWKSSLYSTSYSIEIENLTTGQKINANTSKTSISQSLAKSQPYAWSVTASGVPGSTPSESKKWSFYLSGEDQVSYGPFPPELLSPRPSSTVSPNSEGQISLSWNVSNEDNNITGFDIHLDTVDASALVNTVDANTLQMLVNVNTDQTYFWKVIAKGTNGFKSSSGVYAFVVR